MVFPSKQRNHSDNSGIFAPGDTGQYAAWREEKLENYPKTATELQVSVADLSQPESAEISKINQFCRRANMAFYRSPGADSTVDQPQLRASLKQFCGHFDLSTTEQHRSRGDDGVVPLEVTATGSRSGYIPYTDKPLSWHTDGYYNAEENRIRAMVLHCVLDATSGGANELLDPEIAYIRLRDEDPNFIEALMHQEAMTIPENTDSRSDYRPPRVGPVFFIDKGALQMRYTARSRNIVWRDDAATSRARDFLSEVLAADPLIIRHKLRPGEGLISNNVLHNRTQFQDSADSATTRLLYRIRYRERISAA